MKMIKTLAAALLVLSLIITCTACGGNAVVEPQATEGTTTQSAEESTTNEKVLENPNVFYLTSSTDDSFEKNGAAKDAKEWFENTYGGKLDIKKVGIQEITVLLQAMVSAGNGPDFYQWYDGWYPNFDIKTMSQPVNPYFDLNDAILDIGIMDQYKWKGNHMMVSGKYGNGAAPYVTWFNKTLFEDSGVKTPLEYYNEGTWNFETFRQAGMEMTLDIDKDGKTDQYGFVDWATFDPHVINNGGRFVQYNDDGTIDITWDSTPVKEALQFWQDGLLKDKWICPDVNYYFNWYESGKIAMTFGWSVPMFTESVTEFKYELDFAPAPQGPNAIKGEYYGLNNGYAFANGAKNPEGAAIFLSWMFNRQKDYFDGLVKADESGNIGFKLSEEQKKRYSDYLMNIKTVTPKWVGFSEWNLGGLQQCIVDIGTNGIPPTTAIEKYTPQLRGGIDSALNEKIPVIEPFAGITPEDFESGTMGGITVDGCTPAAADITTDAAELIGGSNSLKIVAPDAGGFILRTDETKMLLPPYHVYTVTFDYKIIKAPAAGGYYAVLGMPKANMADWAVYYGWNQMPAVNDGDTGTYTCNITVDKATTDNVVLIYNGSGGTIVIDNFKIDEVK